MSVPSGEYVGLAVTLLDALGDTESSTETILVQLQALFGPMLTSALQLVDKREVVRVSLPSARNVYQVAGSTGQSYTLYLDLPEQSTPPKSERQQTDIGNAAALSDIEHRPSPDAPTADTAKDDEAKGQRELAAVVAKRNRLRREVQTVKKLYCPCPGYAYNALAGDKNVLCKHLLAALVAWKTQRAVKTEVSLQGVIDLLALRPPSSSITPVATAPAVKSEL